jgi:hypothetical protein
MRQNFGTFVLAMATFFGVLTALWAGLRPANFAQSLGLAVANSGGVNEVRAQYAGFFLACAVVRGGVRRCAWRRHTPFISARSAGGGICGINWRAGGQSGAESRDVRLSRDDRGAVWD